MKKILAIVALATTVMFTSCSKENKLNKKLDGTWNVTSYDGQTVSSDEIMKFEFEKDKGGKGKLTYTEGNANVKFSYSGTYELDKDEVINATLTVLGDTETWKIVVSDYSKDKMTATDENGSKIEFEKE
jgi:uncharacterized protein (TIGR03066 family)